jgi:hypothetical protein
VSVGRITEGVLTEFYAFQAREDSPTTEESGIEASYKASLVDNHSVQSTIFSQRQCDAQGQQSYEEIFRHSSSIKEG